MPALSKRQRILAYRREEAWILAKKTNRPAYVAVNKARGDTRVIQTEGDAFPDQEEWIVREVITPSEARRQLAPPSLRHYYDERENLRGACTLPDERGEQHRKRFGQITEIIGDDEPTPQPHWPEGGDHWHPDPANEESKVTASSEDDRSTPPQEQRPEHFDWAPFAKLTMDQAKTLFKWRERTEREGIPYQDFTPREMNAYTSPVRALVKKGLLMGQGDEAGKNIMDRHYRAATKRDIERRIEEDANIKS